MDDDTTWLKVDDGNRGTFEAAGMGPFMPFGDSQQVMQYYERCRELRNEFKWTH